MHSWLQTPPGFFFASSSFCDNKEVHCLALPLMSILDYLLDFIVHYTTRILWIIFIFATIGITAILFILLLLLHKLLIFLIEGDSTFVWGPINFVAEKYYRTMLYLLVNTFLFDMVNVKMIWTITTTATRWSLTKHRWKEVCCILQLCAQYSYRHHLFGESPSLNNLIYIDFTLLMNMKEKK